MADERHVEVAGCRLHVRMAGTAGALPTVVLESGGGSLLPTWRGIGQALAPHTQVLSYERPGIGGSTGRVESTRPEAVAVRLEALMDAVGVAGPVILVGHSLGGLYSRWFAATRRQRMAGLVLLDPTPEDMAQPWIYDKLQKTILWLVWALIRTGIAQRLVRDLPPESVAAMGNRRHVSAMLAETAARGGTQADVAALPRDASLPVLVISAGSPMRFGKPEMLVKFRTNHERVAAAGAPPHSRYLCLDEATHMSLLTEPRHAQAVAAEILAFMRQLAPQA